MTAYCFHYIEELIEALIGMNSGKAPRPDGLIYKKFSGKLLPHLLDVFNEKRILPPSLSSAVISLQLKPGKSPSERMSYRPISLLSCDTRGDKHSITRIDS